MTKSFRLIRLLALSDALLRRVGIDFCRDETQTAAQLEQEFSRADFVFGCPSELLSKSKLDASVDRSASQMTASRLLEGLPAILTFHGTLFPPQFSEYLPTFNPRFRYLAQTRSEAEFLRGKGWPVDHILLSGSIETPTAVPRGAPSVLYLSRPTNGASPHELCRRTEKEVLKWLIRVADEFGLAIVVRLHPSEHKIRFLWSWVLSVGFHAFHFDRGLGFLAASAAITTHSSAIVLVNAPSSSRFEVFPSGTLNKNVFGPNLGAGTRQGWCQTVYEYHQLSDRLGEHLERR